MANVHIIFWLENCILDLIDLKKQTIIEIISLYFNFRRQIIHDVIDNYQISWWKSLDLNALNDCRIINFTESQYTLYNSTS